MNYTPKKTSSSNNRTVRQLLVERRKGVLFLLHFVEIIRQAVDTFSISTQFGDLLEKVFAAFTCW